MKPIRRGPIKFGGYDNNELLCPRCGGDYLHHERVTTFDRGEDAKNVDLTEIGRGTIFRAVVPSEIANNPSAPQWRCHYFLCRFCGGWSELTISRHKGHSLCAWRECPDVQKSYLLFSAQAEDGQVH